MSGPAARRSLPLPGPVAIHTVVLGILLVAAFLSKGPWDSDYWWHIVTGRLIAAGEFPRTDPFSFTWGGMPWTLHEWLGELMLFRLVDGLGYTGAVLIYALIPGIAIAILAYALHRHGLRSAAVIAATTLTALLVIPYATIRPQAVSWVMFALLTAGLLHLRPERARWTLLLVPLFVLWANLHGLWVVGVAVVAAYAVMSLVGMTPMAGARGWALAMVPLAMLGAAFTPEGPGLLLYPLRYIDSGDWGMAHITEWQSPDFHDPAHIPLLIYMGALAVFGRWRVPWWMSILAFAGIAATLIALRNGPVAAIIGAPALAVGIESALQDWRGPPRHYGPRLALQRRLMEMTLAVIVVVAGIVIFVPRDVEAAIDASHDRELPVQGVQLLIDRVPDGRIVAWYGWGGYVIGNMYELGARVMVDGRNDMYDDSILEEYDRVRTADPGWEAIVDRWEADALLFPPHEAITRGPAAAAGWCEAFRDENEVLFLRTCD
jgi:hypothetical protein